MSYPGGGSSKSGGFDVGGLGDFVKRHGAQVATTALSYKMGGKIGKVLAAGQAADLYKKYQHEQKYKNQQNYSGGGGGGYSGGYDNSGQQGGYSSSHKSGGGLDSLLSTGKGLFHKAEQTIRGKTDGGGHGYSGGSGGYSAGPTGYTAGSGGYAAGSAPPPEVMQYLTNGAQIELTSNMTGRQLQIVSSYTDGALVLDANGNPDSFNTRFTVVRVDSHTIMLHNNNNYVALNMGRLCVFPAGPGGMGIDDCRLTVYEPQRGIIALADGAGQAVAVGIDGLPLMTNYTQSEALFSIRFLYTPPPTY